MSKQWNPDYVAVLSWRQKRVLRMRGDSNLILGAREYYKHNPIDFINHWVDTYDPRNAARGLPTYMPLVMFPRQEELVQFLQDMLNNEADGLVEKARDMGATWVCCAFSVWLWLFWDGSSVGWGSRKEILVDKIGDPDSIFEKLRIIIRRLPAFFLPSGYNAKEHLSYMRIVNPETGSTITGEGGNNIGRGGRKLIYFKDESAHYTHAEEIEASLGDNTRVAIDISSVNGTGNVFHMKRESGVEWSGDSVTNDSVNVFIMDWRDHPMKDQAWYDQRREKARKAGLLHVFAQEVDRDYASAVEGIIIKPEWVTASIDAHIALGFDDSGAWLGALDVADEGKDKNALAFRKGVVLKEVSEWGERDTGVTARRAVDKSRDKGELELHYDSIGVGAGVKAETNRLIEDDLDLMRKLTLVPWNAGASPNNKDEHLIPDDDKSPIIGDFFQNLKAQGWWELARRFEKTYRMREEGESYPVDELISISSDIDNLQTLKKELSQPTASVSSSLKMMVDKKPKGSKSPNMADAVMMAFHPVDVGYSMFD